MIIKDKHWTRFIKNNSFKHATILTSLVLLFVVCSSIALADIVTEAHGISPDTQGSNAAGYGMQFTMLADRQLLNVTKVSTCLATRALLYAPNSNTPLATASFVGDNANFNYDLSAGQSYVIVADNSGSAYQYSIKLSGAFSNITGTYVIWNSGRSWNGTAWILDRPMMNIQSITTGFLGNGISLNAVDINSTGLVSITNFNVTITNGTNYQQYSTNTGIITAPLTITPYNLTYSSPGYNTQTLLNTNANNTVQLNFSRQITINTTIFVQEKYLNNTITSFNATLNGVEYQSNELNVTLPLPTAPQLFNITIKPSNANNSFLTTTLVYNSTTFFPLNTLINPLQNTTMFVNYTNPAFMFTITGSGTYTPITNSNFTLTDTQTGQSWTTSNGTLTINPPSNQLRNYTVTSDLYPSQSFNKTFSIADQSTYYVTYVPIINVSLFDENTFQAFNTTGANITIYIFCPSQVVQYPVTNNTFYLSAPCLFNKVRFNLDYGSTGTYYRSVLWTPSGETTKSFYLANLKTTTVVATTFQILDLTGQYINPRILLSRQINTTDQTILGDYADIEGKITAYLIQNQQYSLHILSDNNEERILGAYYADTSSTKIIKLTDINLGSNIGTLLDGAAFYSFMTNESGIILLRMGYNDTSGLIQLVNFTVRLNNASGVLLMNTLSSASQTDFAYTVNATYQNLPLYGGMDVKYAPSASDKPENGGTRTTLATTGHVYAPVISTGIGSVVNQLKFSSPMTLNTGVFVLLSGLAFVFSVSTGYIGSVIIAALFMFLTKMGFTANATGVDPVWMTVLPGFILAIAVLQFILSRAKANRSQE